MKGFILATGIRDKEGEDVARMIIEIDEIINATIDAQEPGVAVAVVQHGQLIHCKDMGWRTWNGKFPSSPILYFAWRRLPNNLQRR